MYFFQRAVARNTVLINLEAVPRGCYGILLCTSAWCTDHNQPPVQPVSYVKKTGDATQARDIGLR